MRHRSAGLLALFCAAALADEPGKPSGQVVVSLTLDSSIHAGVVDSMEREVEAAVAPWGVEVVWRDGLQTEVYQHLAVIHLRGECRADAPIPAAARVSNSDREALGQTQVVDGKVLPIADVQCDAVRRLIERDLRAAPAAEREELLGRALGRVTGHELYHILLRTRSHGRVGLARPAQTSAELLAPHSTFSAADQRRLATDDSSYVADSAVETGR